MTANDTEAMAKPRSFHVVESTPAAFKRYSDAVIALLADVSTGKSRQPLITVTNSEVRGKNLT